MKILKKIMVIFLILPIATACSGGGGTSESALPGEEAVSNVSCVGEECTTTQMNVEGNFEIAKSTTDSTVDMPSFSVTDEGEKLTITCDNDKTTEDGAAMFSCTLDNYSSMFVLCIHGDVYFADSSTGEDFWTYGCSVDAFYCDQYGFNIASSCVKELNSDFQDFPENLEIRNYIAEKHLNALGW